MKDERECLDPAKRSILAKTSLDSVIEVFLFILLSYYLEEEGSKTRRKAGGAPPWCLPMLQTQGGMLPVAGAANPSVRDYSWTTTNIMALNRG